MECDSKIGLLGWKEHLKNWNFFLKNILKKLNLFFFEKTQNWTLLFQITRRIEPFFQCDSKNWTLFLIWFKELLFLIMTQRIQLFLQSWSKELDFLWWLTDLNVLENMSQRIEPFFFLNMIQRIEPFIIWLKELSLFSFLTQRIEPFFSSNMTQRIEPFFLNMTQRIPQFFFDITFLWYNSKNWLFCMILRIELFSNMTQRIEIFFFKYDAKNWTLFLRIWLKELNSFSLNMTQRLKPFSLNLTQRIEPFSYLTRRIEFFLTCRKELSLFLNMTERIEPFFSCNSKNWTFFLWNDSKNWTLSQKKSLKNGTLLFSRNMTQRI